MEYKVGDRFKNKLDSTVIKITKLYPGTKLVDIFIENYDMYEGLETDHIDEYYKRIEK